MYTAVRTYTTTDAAELARRVQEEFVPMMRDLPGFIGYYIVDGGDGQMASITVCENESGVEESNRRAASWVQERLAELITDGPHVIAGDTVVSQQAD